MVNNYVSGGIRNLIISVIEAGEEKTIFLDSRVAQL